VKHPVDKARIRFRKSGALRLLSHHDLMRTFERLLRRSQLPFHRSQGFHPKPRLIFALSLPLGVVGCEEVAVVVPAERLLNVRQRSAEVLAARECWVDRQRPHSRQAGRRLDVRPFLVDLLVDQPPGPSDSARLEIVLRLTTAGTARPEEVLALLGIEDLLDAGAIFERSRLELHDEEMVR
jgi:hypothetical protein